VVSLDEGVACRFKAFDLAWSWDGVLVWQWMGPRETCGIGSEAYGVTTSSAWEALEKRIQKQEYAMERRLRYPRKERRSIDDFHVSLLVNRHLVFDR
jgi:hypothetical protein